MLVVTPCKCTSDFSERYLFMIRKFGIKRITIHTRFYRIKVFTGAPSCFASFCSDTIVVSSQSDTSSFTMPEIATNSVSGYSGQYKTAHLARSPGESGEGCREEAAGYRSV